MINSSESMVFIMKCKIIKKLICSKNLYTLGLLLFIVLFFSIFSQGFLGKMNFLNIFREVVFVATVGTAATFLLVAGYIDLSLGSLLALSGILYAYMCKAGVPFFIALVAIMVFGSIVGLINGLIVSILKIPAVIATLAMLYLLRGLVFIISGISPIRPSTDWFSFLGRGKIGPLPFQLFIILIVLIVFLILEKKSLLYKYAVAIGGNQIAAVLSGINVNRIIYILYLVTGSLTGLAGAIMASKLSVGEQLVGNGFEFDIIVAMLIGGTNFSGGEGSVLGTVYGAFIISILGIGFNMMSVPSFYQYVVKGILFVLAVAFNGFMSKRISRYQMVYE